MIQHILHIPIIKNAIEETAKTQNPIRLEQSWISFWNQDSSVIIVSSQQAERHGFDYQTVF
jgi:predicted GNAT family acetyltransferase